MAENTITRAQALEIAIAAIKDTNPDAAAALQKMHASITKPRAKDNSKAIENERYAKLVYDQIGDEPFTNKQVCQNVKGLPIGSKGVVSPQKVTPILAAGVRLGLFTKTSIADGAVTLYQKVVNED